MSLEVHQIAEAFCRWRFTRSYPYLADEIKWNVVGKKEYVGREAVIARCEEATKFLDGLYHFRQAENHPRRRLCHCGRCGSISRSGKSNL